MPVSEVHATLNVEVAVPGMLLLVDVMCKDKRWHQAVVVEQHASGVETEL